MTRSRVESTSAVPWHVQAAKASWIAPLAAGFMNCAVGRRIDDRTTALAVAAIALAMILAGLAFAAWAIIGAFTKGPRGVLGPAIVGVLLNGLVVYVVADAFLNPREDAAASGDWIPRGDDWYVDQRALFAVQFPEGWEVIPYPEEGGAVVALAPIESHQDGLRERIAINTGVIPPRSDPKAFLAAELEDFRQNTPGFREHGSGRKAISGVPWSWLDFRQVVDGNELRITIYMTVRDSRSYAVMCGSAPDRAEALEETFDDCVSSIRMP